jgi:hypothetical protein
MISAMIVLSAPTGRGTPVEVAAVRMLGVSLGAVIGSLVSVTILASRRESVVARSAANLLAEFVMLLGDAIQPAAESRNGAAAKRLARYKLEARVRQAVRELALLVRDRPDALPTPGPAAAMVKYTVQMHADIVFLKRELQADEQPTPPPVTGILQEFARAFGNLAAKAAAMARGDPQHIDIQPLRDSCGAAAQALRESRPGSEGARLMLRRLVEDFAALIRSMDRALRPEDHARGTAVTER